MIIFLIALFNCAKRGKENEKNENSENHNLKDEYMLLCFPCLRKKPNFRDVETNSLDMNDQYEYIVEKYAIRKVPFVVANTTEEMEKIQKEMEAGDLKPEKVYKPQTVYSVHELITCGGKGSKNDTAKDILDSGPHPTPTTSGKLNYVAIPTKASARQKDIMMTKREITNQYLNNFSSVFIDNLKDPVPKDPERLPKLGKPYTSSIKHMPMSDVVPTSSRHAPRTKSGRLVYNFEKDGEKPSTSGAMSKTVFLVHPEDRKSAMEGVSTPFKTILYPHSSGTDDDVAIGQKPFGLKSYTHKQEINRPKVITYEDIQSLDVGYDFPNHERHGVKPKMIRIRGNYEPERMQKPNSQNSSEHSRNPPLDFKPSPKRYYTDRSPDFKRKYPRPSYTYNETSFLSPLKQSPRVSANSPPKIEKPADDALSCKICQMEKSERVDQERTSPRFFTEPKHNSKDEAIQSLPISRSQSFDNLKFKNKEIVPIAVRGFDKRTSSNEEFETDTTGSLYSRESKTSSLLTTPRSSEPQLDKKQTLRWKIIIKHHKDEDAQKNLANS